MLRTGRGVNASRMPCFTQIHWNGSWFRNKHDMRTTSTGIGNGSKTSRKWLPESLKTYLSCDHGVNALFFKRYALSQPTLDYNIGERLPLQFCPHLTTRLDRAYVEFLRTLGKDVCEFACAGSEVEYASSMNPSDSK